MYRERRGAVAGRACLRRFLLGFEVRNRRAGGGMFFGVSGFVLRAFFREAVLMWRLERGRGRAGVELRLR